MSAPAQIVLGYLTLKDSGLLKAAVQDFAGLSDTLKDCGIDKWGDEMPSGTVWPEVRGTIEQQQGIRAVLRELEEVFGPVLVGGSKLTPLHIELLDGAMEGYRPGTQAQAWSEPNARQSRALAPLQFADSTRHKYDSDKDVALSAVF